MTPSIKYIDVELDANNFQRDVHKMLDVLRPSWKGAELTMKKFSGGVWNLMTCFHRKDDPNKKDAIVFRVINQMNIEINNYSMDRDFIAMQIGHACGCFPEPLAVCRNTIAYQYYPGRQGNAFDYMRPNIIKGVCEQMAALHRVDLPSLDVVDCKGRVGKYSMEEPFLPRMDFVGERLPDGMEDPANDAKYQKYCMSKAELRKNFADMKKTLDELKFPKTFSHCDIHLKNIIYDDESDTVQLCDWEFAGYHYRAYDLAYTMGSRTMLEYYGLFNPDEPRITPEIRTQWLRCYADAYYEPQKKNKQPLPEVLYELVDVENAIMGTYIVPLYMMYVQTGIINVHFKPNFDSYLAELRSTWDDGMAKMEERKKRYLEVREQCNKLGFH